MTSVSVHYIFNLFNSSALEKRKLSICNNYLIIVEQMSLKGLEGWKKSA